MAKVHPTVHMSIEQLSRAMDDLDRRIRAAMPVVAGVFIGVTANVRKKLQEPELIFHLRDFDACGGLFVETVILPDQRLSEERWRSN
jgi:hypothetical protein